jgi:endonuclease-3 related protein
MTSEKPAPATLTSRRLMEMFDLLLDHFGPQHWWPGETQLEVSVGAVLTQNTSWKNVEKTIRNLKQKGLLSLEELHALSPSALAPEIRSACFFNLKAKRLKGLIGFVMERYEGDLPRMLKEAPSSLREGLLSVKGIGRETADSILLYAAAVPIFVIDAYTYRILYRHGMAEEEATYEDLQALFMENLPEDPALFNEFHALIVSAGKEFCRKEPRCAGCPLMHWGPTPPLG